MLKTITKSSENGFMPNGTFIKTGLQESRRMKLFKDELKYIYWTERALTKAIPKMIGHTASEELMEVLEGYLITTEKKVLRLELVFKCMQQAPVAKKCEVLMGLIKEACEVMGRYRPGAMCDAGIISMAQKVVQYKIAAYGTLCHFAETLGVDDGLVLLEVNLYEEMGAHEKLSALAAFNIEAEEIDTDRE